MDNQPPGSQEPQPEQSRSIEDELQDELLLRVLKGVPQLTSPPLSEEEYWERFQTPGGERAALEEELLFYKRYLDEHPEGALPELPVGKTTAVLDDEAKFERRGKLAAYLMWRNKADSE